MGPVALAIVSFYQELVPTCARQGTHLLHRKLPHPRTCTVDQLARLAGVPITEATSLIVRCWKAALGKCEHGQSTQTSPDKGVRSTAGGSCAQRARSAGEASCSPANPLGIAGMMDDSQLRPPGQGYV